ncbi:MAG: DUF3800 domain-containing protein [FCB group bacterium]|nr:DUF3800 domain-containing protein [FCB group bacterium]
MPVMVLGAIWCPKAETRRIAENVRAIKVKHGLPPFFEIKWTKVSPAKVDFYRDIINYFFEEKDLHFRGLIAEKTDLKHAEYGQDHSTWYYKMYFNLLKVIITPADKYYIYIDIKDTRGREKVRKLHEVICNSKWDFDRNIIEFIQQVRSHEVEQVQLADLISGAVGYRNRDKNTSGAKLNLVELISEKSGYSLRNSTLLQEEKFNLFRWKPDRKVNTDG